MLTFDEYVTDVLMRDLVGHDRRPVSFLVYLWIAAEQQRRGRAVQISYQDLAESIGVRKAPRRPRSDGSCSANSWPSPEPPSPPRPATPPRPVDSHPQARTQILTLAGGRRLPAVLLFLQLRLKRLLPLRHIFPVSRRINKRVFRRHPSTAHTSLACRNSRHAPP